MKRFHQTGSEYGSFQWWILNALTWLVFNFALPEAQMFIVHHYLHLIHDPVWEIGPYWTVSIVFIVIGLLLCSGYCNCTNLQKSYVLFRVRQHNFKAVKSMLSSKYKWNRIKRDLYAGTAVIVSPPTGSEARSQQLLIRWYNQVIGLLEQASLLNK